MDIEAIVRIYNRKIKPEVQAELNWFREQPTLASAIKCAALAVDSKGKRYSHQRRLRKSTLEQAEQVLLDNLVPIEHCRSFNDLFLLVESLLQPISGAGELYIYDASLRIGTKLNLSPTVVYLHRGARVGAQVLGICKKARTIEVSKLPKDLQQLEPYAIEDVLCIFKDKFKELEAESIELEQVSSCY